ncbi:MULTISPECIES: NADPH-dependent 2,4-dienoyl-CoA reductase [unclassified Nocardioides]|uniref:NADPH-dependent 2,4-dienoyl-CoA reductase n=1 Tax=unclassified Nocardioides TaxID=2615069 RepID=UPI000702418D|nr:MULTISPECIES: NADPH-dependent 2,4-dienoyl-CoA reductase [unclassified Nocardioides]KRC56917.1 NADPH-dependent 2,4-dienoyl-CoA reductase [Nocardioides sp. Root79]KRC77126.1 NADPH-dependent 2,4-dienoyl-CoA reductase [Nocardioides sp. Root240]
MTSYPLLTSKAVVGGLELQSRAVMGSMHTGLEDRPWHIDEMAAYFAERAAGGVGLIVTGGYAPNVRGWLLPFGSQMTTRMNAHRHQRVTDAVHENGGKIALQILHAGRYGYTPFSVSASATKSPITPFKASALSTRAVEKTVQDFVASARLAQKAGYDGVEIMGSEGYLINQFLAARTNRRTDKWGGSAEARMRFPVEVVRRIRQELPDFFVMYRMSLLDLVPDGQTWDETVELAHRIEAAGASVINTGIGWHEARVPTIVTSVPRGAWVDSTLRLKGVVDIPVCASNRINTPDLAEAILEQGIDLVSMARPFLADSELVNKARDGRADEINTCIGCNQACLDHTFQAKRASCLVNPRACHETTLVLGPTRAAKRVAIVGGGPAGLATAVSAAERGHDVTLFEANDEIGGQFRLAMQIPGKEEFAETLRYFRRRMEVLGVNVKLATRATPELLSGYDEVVVATGVAPRTPSIPGIDHAKVVSYPDAITGRVAIGGKVAVMGAGGIGFDVTELLAHTPETVEEWKAHWGVADPAVVRGGVTDKAPRTPAREVWLLQRKESTQGKGLGKTSGWVHRAAVKDLGVHQLSGVSYDRVDDAGLHITVDGSPKVLDVDHVVVCAGQESVRGLYDELLASAFTGRVHLIGGADVAAELDAKRAIKQGTELAAAL